MGRASFTVQATAEPWPPNNCMGPASAWSREHELECAGGDGGTSE